jgi:hypothetical protein
VSRACFILQGKEPVCRKLGISQATFYPWKRQYTGLFFLNYVRGN